MRPAVQEIRMKFEGQTGGKVKKLPHAARFL